MAIIGRTKTHLSFLTLLYTGRTFHNGFASFYLATGGMDDILKIGDGYRNNMDGIRMEIGMVRL